MKKALIGLAIAGGLGLVSFAGKRMYDRLFKNGNATGLRTYTTEAIANLAAEASLTSGRGSMGVLVWTILVLALLGAIAAAVYWWWGRGQDGQHER